MHPFNFKPHLYDQWWFKHVHPTLLIFSYVARSCSRGTPAKSQVVSKDVQFYLLLHCLSVLGCPFYDMLGGDRLLNLLVYLKIRKGLASHSKLVSYQI